MSILQNIIEKTTTAKLWKKVGIRQHHGIALPLSALHSEKSLGIGEFQDLIGLINWCNEVGFDVIQLLPLNDTGYDISPYSAISSCALDPVYLTLRYHFPEEKDFPLVKKTKRVAYQDVKKQKLNWLKKTYPLHLKKAQETEKFKKFMEIHPWLIDYGLYHVFLDKHKALPWTKWEKEVQKPSEEKRKKWLKKHREEVNFHIYLQFLCFEEMQAIKHHAEKKQILLKGDVPILLSPNSVDVWANQQLFIMDMSAGAPPDMFSPEGQDWGFPLFNWEKLEEEDYRWWKQRLSTCAECFHIYRIDHIVGFFRIWATEKDQKPVNGQFVSRNRYLWQFEGKERLEMMIKASTMLPIAEDLGVIPGEVNSLLKELGICGTRVMRWQKYWDEDGSYIPPENYDELTLTTVGTHDSETLQQWWKKFPSDAKQYAKQNDCSYSEELTIDIRRKILSQSHHSASIFHINPFQEYLALFNELVSENPDKERINIPGKNLASNWTYKFHTTLEKITSHQALREEIAKILNRRGSFL